ncbi:pksN [Symbiodinium sp. CCMP2592]|nr:pksN [Symbiodinium sp. CCMP2592]
MVPSQVWLIARLGHRLDELVRSLKAAFTFTSECRVLLLTGESYRVLDLQPGDFEFAASELDWVQQIRATTGLEVSSLLEAVHILTSKRGSCPVVLLDENAKEDWSWAAPLANPVVCLGVHEDFEEETMAIRAAAPTHAAQLGPVALHSSACLHLLSSVRLGDAGAPLSPVRPMVVQKDSAPRAVSARSFRRALPRRQSIRFFLHLDDSPFSETTRTEVHQAIVAACLVSKSVYDDRDTRLCLVWPSKSGLRCVMVDRSLMDLAKGRLVPAEGPVIAALKLKVETDEKSVGECLCDLQAESRRLSLGQPAVVRVSVGEPSSWPKWQVQAGWPSDPMIMLFLQWQGDLPIPETTSIHVPAGAAAKAIITLQHWHNLGVLPATLTPRPRMEGEKGDTEVLKIIEECEQIRPERGRDVCLDMAIPFRGRVAGRVRMGHVLFADCGVKVMCKEQRLGASFHVVVGELRVGDTLHCRGYPGYEYKGHPAIFATEILAIEPTCTEGLQPSDSILFRDESILVVEKPAGKLAWEDNRHRHERGTALRVDAEHLLCAPEAEVSGPAVYTMTRQESPSHCLLEYFILVAGRPAGVSSCRAALRPARGKPKQDAETQLDTLWEGEDCSLLRASVRGPETKSQVCRHLHLLGFPVWGDRRFGNQRANLRSRAVFGLARPWCHLGRLEIFGSFGGLRVETLPPPDLLRVLHAVGGDWQFQSKVQRLPPVMVLSHFENGLGVAYYVTNRDKAEKLQEQEGSDATSKLSC